MNETTRQISNSRAILCIPDLERGESHTVSMQLQEGSPTKSNSSTATDTYICTETRRYPCIGHGTRGEVTMVDVVDAKTIRYNRNDVVIARNVRMQATQDRYEEVTPLHMENALTQPKPMHHSGVPFSRPRVNGVDTLEGNGRKEKLSDRYLFSQALSTCSQLLDLLIDAEGERRQVKVAHGLYGRREFGVVSAIVVPADDGGARQLRLGVLWQIMSRPRRAICVTFSLSSSKALQLYCTCDILISAIGVSKQRCIHVQACLQDLSLIQEISGILGSGGGRYFGECITCTDVDIFPAVELERRGSVPVTARTDEWMRNWSFWVVYDTGRCLFVPVLKVKLKTFQCQLCRGSSNRTGSCSHEASCKWNLNSLKDVAFSEDEGYIESDESDSSESSDEDNGMNQSALATEAIHENQKYLATGIDRTLLMCYGDRCETIRIASYLENLEASETLALSETKLSTCPTCGSGQQGTDAVTFRKVRLFTLSHGVPTIELQDWTCGRCKTNVYYSGKWHAIFPVRKKSAFTVELLYVWVHIVCYQGQSFRNAYMTTRLTASAASTLARFRDSGKDKNIDGDSKRSRRRANEAFRAFINTLDVRGDEITSQLFSCRDCEIPLTEADKAQLGLHSKDGQNMDDLRRFKGLVVDGTAAGILGKLPNFDRQPLKITAPRRIRRDQRMVPKHVNQNSIRELCAMARRALRRCVNGKRTRRIVQDHERFSFMASPPPLEFKKGKNRLHLESKHLDTARLYVDSASCFCSPPMPFDVESVHSSQCNSKRIAFESSKDYPEVDELLRSCFSLDYRLHELADASEYEAHSDDELETEHLQERFDYGDVSDSSNNSYDDSAEQNSRTTGHWWVTVLIPQPTRVAQLVEAFLDLIPFLLTEHTGLVYISPFTISQEFDPDGYLRDAKFIQQGELQRSCSVLAESSFQLHEKLADVLLDFSACLHSDIISWPCKQCTSRFSAILSNIQGVNPVISRFCEELLHAGRRIPQTSRTIAQSVASCLKEHILCAAEYFAISDKHSSPDSKDYWRRYGSVLLNEIAGTRDEGVRTGICFPGRSRYRPGVVFEGKETHNCIKKYTTAEYHSPGLLTVQCVCENPKLIGFIVMTRAESTSLALSSILSHLPIPPRVLYYDNGCNLFASTLLRFPWLLHQCRVVVDRFHYKSHKCCAFFDPDCYYALDEQRSTTAESFNARIARSVHHMRYLRGNNLVPFLQIRFALLNLAALYQQHFDKTDLEDEDLSSFLREIIHCSCYSCNRNISFLNRDRRDSEEIN